LDPSKGYDLAVERLDARKPESRGSGTKTSVLATFLAARSDLSQPFETIALAANSLGSDTDTIGTMAGAIIGACTSVECSAPLQDRG
jgi:ADP-ribosylglycohydrolase